MDETSRVLAEISVLAESGLTGLSMKNCIQYAGRHVSFDRIISHMVQKFTGCGTFCWHGNILSVLAIPVTDEIYELMYCLLLVEIPAVA